jgi:hypothetical protein
MNLYVIVNHIYDINKISYFSQLSISIYIYRILTLK